MLPAGLDETRSHLAELFAGRYTVHERLPVGGLALFYRARGPRRDVVLAILPLDCEGDDKLREVFEKAMAKVSTVKHPLLAKMVDSGVQLGVPFVAYESVARRPLEYTLADVDLGDESLDPVKLGGELLEAIGKAHTEGVVHGDLTPSTVLLADDGSVQVVGLGFGPLLRHASPERTGPTGRGSGPAAVRYMAPEVLAGSPGEPRSDLYSIGAILHHVVSGGPPGKAPFNDQYTGPVETVIRRAMSQYVGERFSSADEMGEVLSASPKKLASKREPSAAIPLWDQPSGERTHEPTPSRSRSPWRWLVLVLIAAVVLAVWVGMRDGDAEGDDVATNAESSEAVVDERGSEVEPAAEEADDDEESAGDDEPGAANDQEFATDESEGVVATDESEGVDAEESATDDIDSDEPPRIASGGPLAGDLPPFLDETLERIAHEGHEFEEDDFRPIYGWIRNHRDDARGHLVLCRAFMARGWYTAAEERYEHVFRLDPDTARAAPQSLRDLVVIVAKGEDMIDLVTPLIRRHYGDELEHVRAVIAETLEQSDSRRSSDRLSRLDWRVERM